MFLRVSSRGDPALPLQVSENRLVQRSDSKLLNQLRVLSPWLPSLNHILTAWMSESLLERRYPSPPSKVLRRSQLRANGTHSYSNSSRKLFFSNSSCSRWWCSNNSNKRKTRVSSRRRTKMSRCKASKSHSNTWKMKKTRRKMATLLYNLNSKDNFWRYQTTLRNSWIS